MRTSDFFPSRYFKACDLNSGPQTVSIREVVVEEIGQDKESKPVVYFDNKKKGLCLNVTNCRMIEDHFGDSKNWPGKSIELYSDKVPFKGDRVDAVRVRVPKQASADELLDEAPPSPKSSAPADPVDDLDDEIPGF